MQLFPEGQNHLVVLVQPVVLELDHHQNPLGSLLGDNDTAVDPTLESHWHKGKALKLEIKRLQF